MNTPPSSIRGRDSIAKALRLYAISKCDGDLGEIEKALQAGVTFFQLREKHLSHGDFLAKAKAVRSFCPGDVPLIIDDRIDIALESGADGVHIGPNDGSVAEARKRLGPGKILGVSARSVSQALAAEKAGADYLGVGAVFPTSTKADAKPMDRKTLRAICASVSIPVVAIGGITADNLGDLAGTGIDGTAVVSAVFDAPDISLAVRDLLEATGRMLAVAPRHDRGAIIDLDGVVLDSLGVWKEVDAMYLERYGLQDRPEAVLRLNNATTVADAANYLIEVWKIPRTIEEVKEEFHELLGAFYEKSLRLLPGVREALTDFRRQGLRTALVTASPEDLVMAALRRNGIDGLFDHFFFDTEKTDPSVFLHVVEVLGTGTRRTVVYDDLDRIRATAESLGIEAHPALPVSAAGK